MARYHYGRRYYRRRRQGPDLRLVMALLGGPTGILLGWAIVWFTTGQDAFGLLALLRRIAG